nr:hypothetical protein [Tanacetum cinerariifolium]
ASQYLDDPDIHALQDITYSDDEEEVGAEANFSNLETNITVSPIPTSRVHKVHHVTQIIGDLSSAPQTRKEPKRVHQALKDPSWIEAMQEELLQFKMQKGYTQEEGIDYEEVFAPVAWIKAIRLFLAYAFFMGFMVYQIDVKSAFFYGTIEEEVYVCQPIGFEDPDYPDKVCKVVKALYGLHQAPRAWYEILANYLLENSFQRGKIDQNLFIKRKKDGKSGSTLIDTEKPLLKDPDGEDVDVLTYRLILNAVSLKLLLFGLTIDAIHLLLFGHKVDIDAAAEDEDAVEPTPPSPTHATTPPPQQDLFLSPPQVSSTPPSSPNQSPIAQPSSPPQQQPSQPAQTTDISMDLLNTLLETCLKRLKKVGIAQRVESSDDTVMDDQEDASKQGEIAKIDADEGIILEEVEAEVLKDTDDTDEAEPAELKEASAPRRRRGVIIHDPEETATPLVIVHSEPKSKDKGKGILVEEPKPLKRQVKRKEKQDNTVMRYQALKRKPITEAHARKKMMVYLKNMAGFKMNFFKDMTYDEIRPIFEKHFNSIVAFLEKREKEIEEDEIIVSKRKSESSEQKAAKTQKIDEEVEELKTHLQIMPNDEDDVYTEATLLDLKVLVVDYQIHSDHNKPYYKINRADGTRQLFLSFISLLRNFDIEDLEMLWKIVQERFASSEPKNFSDAFC